VSLRNALLTSEVRLDMVDRVLRFQVKSVVCYVMSGNYEVATGAQSRL